MPRLSEDALITTYFASFAGAGALKLGDDAAIMKPQPGEDLILTKDMLVAGVHFFADDPPGDIARKALRVNLSDLAAKGAEPRGFLLGLGLPADWQEDWLKAFSEGLKDDATQFGIDLLGGDTVCTPGPLTLSVTAIGSVPEGRMVPRAGARDGDVIFVSGTIGDAALGLRLRLAEQRDASWIEKLDEAERAHLSKHYLLPEPRLALREALREHAGSAMDISDGLAGDLAKMLRLDRLTADIEVDKVPLSSAARTVLSDAPESLQTILCGGDDYEILCTVPPEKAASFQRDAERAGIAMQAIGRCRAGEGLPKFARGDGHNITFESGSFQHF